MRTFVFTYVIRSRRWSYAYAHLNRSNQSGFSMHKGTRDTVVTSSFCVLCSSVQERKRRLKQLLTFQTDLFVVVVFFHILFFNLETELSKMQQAPFFKQIWPSSHRSLQQPAPQPQNLHRQALQTSVQHSYFKKPVQNHHHNQRQGNFVHIQTIFSKVLVLAS